MIPVTPPVTSGPKDPIVAEKLKRVLLVSGIVTLALGLIALMSLYYFAREKSTVEEEYSIPSAESLLEGYNYALESENSFYDPETGDTFIYPQGIQLFLTDIREMQTYVSYNEEYKYRLFTVGSMDMALDWQTLYLLVEVKDKNNELGLIYPYSYLEFDPLVSAREINDVRVSGNTLFLDVTHTYIDMDEGVAREEKVTYGLEVLEGGMLRKYQVK